MRSHIFALGALTSPLPIGCGGGVYIFHTTDLHYRAYFFGYEDSDGVQGYFNLFLTPDKTFGLGIGRSFAAPPGAEYSTYFLWSRR